MLDIKRRIVYTNKVRFFISRRNSLFLTLWADGLHKVNNLNLINLELRYIQGMLCTLFFYVYRVLNQEVLIISDKVRINEKIKGKEFRIISSTGEQLGIMSIADALEAARKEELDLVEISPAAVPPVCKIMDYGKYKYEQTRKAKDAKKKQKVVVVKEVKLRTRIDDHDLETKVNAIKKFLEKDNKVKVTLVQFGREKSYQDMGIELLDQVAEQLDGVAEVEKRYKESQKYLMLSAKKQF